MNIIKTINGIRTVIWVFFLTFSSLFFSSCEKDELEPSEYYVSISNNYFERIDSLKISDYELNSLEVNEISEQVVLHKESYPFSFFTESELYFEGLVDIKGLNEKLVVTINKNGEITID